MYPSPFWSSSAIMRATSSDVVLDPSAAISSFSSAREILPSPFLSNLLKILRTSSSMATLREQTEKEAELAVILLSSHGSGTLGWSKMNFDTCMLTYRKKIT